MEICNLDLHVWVWRRTFDLQIDRRVTTLAIIQPVGPQAEVHLRRPFNLQTDARLPEIALVKSDRYAHGHQRVAAVLISSANVTFHGSLLRRSWKSSPKMDARASSSLSCWIVRSSVPSAGVRWLLILLHGRPPVLSHTYTLTTAGQEETSSSLARYSDAALSSHHSSPLFIPL